MGAENKLSLKSKESELMLMLSCEFRIHYFHNNYAHMKINTENKDSSFNAKLKCYLLLGYQIYHNM